MTVTFVVDGREVTYGFGDCRVPVKGDRIEFDGTDPELSGGLYLVKTVVLRVGLRGPQEAVVDLEALLSF